ASRSCGRRRRSPFPPGSAAAMRTRRAPALREATSSREAPRASANDSPTPRARGRAAARAAGRSDGTAPSRLFVALGLAQKPEHEKADHQEDEGKYDDLDPANAKHERPASRELYAD